MKTEAPACVGHPASAGGAETEDGERLLCARPETREHLRGLAYLAYPDPSLCEELVQEGLLACCREEREHPGLPDSWYEGHGFLRIRDCVRQGRNLDSLKRRSGGCSLDELDELDWAAEGDPLQEICAEDEFDELMSHLDPEERETLQMLSEELGVREIARAIRVRPAKVIERCRHIRTVALGLGICPSPHRSSR